jgi:PAS domain-containing protein
MAPEHGSRPEELIHNADLALYRAKETKGTSLNYCVFEPAMEHHLEARQLHRLELQASARSHGRTRMRASAADDLSLHDARITTALNHMSQGLCMFDADKKLIVCNERYGQMYGIPPEQMQPGTPFRQILQAGSTAASSRSAIRKTTSGSASKRSRSGSLPSSTII